MLLLLEEVVLVSIWLGVSKITLTGLLDKIKASNFFNKETAVTTLSH
jgi:hypothetical protein